MHGWPTCRVRFSFFGLFDFLQDALDDFQIVLHQVFAHLDYAGCIGRLFLNIAEQEALSF